MIATGPRVGFRRQPCQTQVDWGYNMSSIIVVSAKRFHRKPPCDLIAGVCNMAQLFAVALGAATLGACAQSSVTQKSELLAGSRQATQEHNQKTSILTNKHLGTKKHTPFAPNRSAAETQFASHGVASFYTEGTQTASGERFNTRELTAAHRTLPFGTQLRVTNIATGRFVTVRVNDRGPFIPGRVVDVSHFAAEKLGMVAGGIAKVKLDIVQ
jgi:peptidoglycan lytic transglycosylase